MGRKLRIGAAIALVLVAGCVTVASATSSGDNRSSDSDGRKVVVLDLVAQVVDRQEIDEAPAGQSLGDWTVLEVDLISGGNKVGEESSICVLTRIDADGTTTSHCKGVSTLPGGQVTTELAVKYGPNEVLKADPYFTAIKGGTGKYRTAHGDGRLQELNQNQWRLTLRIIL